LFSLVLRGITAIVALPPSVSGSTIIVMLSLLVLNVPSVEPLTVNRWLPGAVPRGVVISSLGNLPGPHQRRVNPGAQSCRPPVTCAVRDIARLSL
jgi:hypothetical protein